MNVATAKPHLAISSIVGIACGSLLWIGIAAGLFCATAEADLRFPPGEYHVLAP